MTQHQLEIRGGNEIIARARAWTGQIANALGADRVAAADFILAISEACTNVVRYAYTGQPESYLILTAEQIDERIIFRVRDFGVKFDPELLRSSDPGDELRVGGYGIYLMQQVMDEVRYITDHPVGTELILVRRRSG
jgi:serine/threonine-protein kinase RsbW